jgi:hypothetical protein
VSFKQPDTKSEPRAAARGSFSPARVFAGLLLVVLVAGCSASSGRLAALGAFGPNEILAGSLVRLEATTTLHVDATLAGSVKAGSLGSLAGGLPIGLLGSLKLDGATVSSDVDISNRAFHLSASFPALFGATAEMILVGDSVYTKLNLLGGKFTKSPAPSGLSSIGVPNATGYGFSDALDRVRAVLEASGTTATLAGRASIDGRDSYHLLVTVPQDGLIRILGSSGATAIGLPPFELGPSDYWVYVDTLQPARFKVAITSAQVGSFDLDVTLTRYGQPVAISAPPAGQIKGG